MTVNDYQRQAMRTLNPALGKKDVLINSVMGLCGEAGEAIDIVKKWLAQGHELDRAHLVRELGDVAWYLAEAATACCRQTSTSSKSASPRASTRRRPSTGTNRINKKASVYPLLQRQTRMQFAHVQ